MAGVPLLSIRIDCRLRRSFRLLVVVRAGVVASMDGVPTRHVIVGTMSPCPVEDSCIPGCHDISSVVPVD